MRAPLTYEAARAGAESVISAAQADRSPLAVAVVDRGGITRILLAADGAGPIAIETARRKAYTSAVTSMPTAVFARFAASPEMAVAPPHLVDPDLLPAPGGVPLVVDGAEVIGGIGVGGADGDTDVRLAEMAAQVVSDLLHPGSDPA